MNEDNLDKITRLCFAINRKHNVNVSFQVGYFFDGVLGCSLSLDSVITNYTSVNKAIEALEQLLSEEKGNSSSAKSTIISKIEKLQIELNQYQQTLYKLEGVHHVI